MSGGMPTVVILGGGVGGMSAAHELIERGFQVQVYEMKPVPGGKARSIFVPGSGTDGRKNLPGEHGFRFFPRFYHHIDDTLKQIPYPGNRLGVFDNLVQARREMLALKEKSPVILLARFPRSLKDLRAMLKGRVEASSLKMPEADREFFADRVWQLVTSCRDRAVQEYERIGWWEFLEADQRSEAFRHLLVEGVTRTLVAAQPKTASTQSGGEVLTELCFAATRPGRSCDCLLDGPTSDVWLDPWLAFLRGRGVDYHLEAEVTGIHCEKGRISGATVVEGGRTFTVTGDYYVAAVPVEVMDRLLTDDMIKADPTLVGIRPLSKQVDWMTGIQFFLTESLPIVNGHVTYIDTPWSLTSISQRQFWKDKDLSQYGDGSIRDILSVDISDWHAPGIINRKPDGTYKTAQECTPEEIRNDVLAQLQQCLNVDGKQVLRDEIVRTWFLDSDIIFHDHVSKDAEPLLVNRVRSWDLRPDAWTAIPNFFIGADYVRSNTNLATMEAANESAKRAVNGIISASGASVPLCSIWPMYQPWVLIPSRWHDQRRFNQGLPWKSEMPLLFKVLHAVYVVIDSLIHRIFPGKTPG